MSKLTISDVVSIKSLLKQKVLTKTAIAKQFNVSRGTIVDISTGRIHKDKFPTNRIKKKSAGNVLVIGDLHHPFCLKKYLDFCSIQYEKFNCRKVIFIGDIIDNHYASFHETDPDGLSGGDELDLAITHVKPWIDRFPEADVCIGNHDRMVMRRAFAGNIPKRWIREYNDVLNAKGWNFLSEVVLDNVQYIHGECGTARTKAKNDKFSTVQGHLHTQAYVESLVGRDTCIFGMQVGCGIDRHSYAMAYAQTGPKPAIGCGVVLDNGRLPIQIMADLENSNIRL